MIVAIAITIVVTVLVLWAWDTIQDLKAHNKYLEGRVKELEDDIDYLKSPLRQATEKRPKHL